MRQGPGARAADGHGGHVKVYSRSVDRDLDDGEAARPQGLA